MTDVNEALKIHRVLIEKFGGVSGVRDMNGLQAALGRPFATFDNKELYPKAVDKAAALIESIISNHPFVDGNKRTGYVLMRLLLFSYGYDISATQESKYEFVINIASGKIRIEEIRIWLEVHLTKKR
jgi:death-on-curing protein